MSTHWGPPAHNFVPEYQQSGIPFVTSSTANEVNTTPVLVPFPFVTRWVQIFNTDGTAGDTLRVGFTQNGVSSNPNANYMILSGGQSTGRLELKCTGLWFLKHGANPTSFSVVAGLTSVKPAQFFAVTGSNGVEGVG
jgi:hypothetical protein